MRSAICLLLALVIGGGASAGDVDDARLRAADDEPASWLSYGRTWSEQRMSPLAGIDAGNVANLELAWSFDTGTVRGLEATPLVVDGVMYTTGTWSVVFALDAKTGELLWKWDPRVPRSVGQHACCDVVNRGVAFYAGRVYSGTLDGRLVALDAKTGKPVWDKLTVPEGRYTITGAPRVLGGKVIIGSGGAEYGVRGYVSAYDAETGERVWRTHTVPGNPADGFESPAMEKAAATWKGEWWKLGGGGTVWDSIAYDPDLDLLYIGTGNGSPWVRKLRSPGGGDNLYLSSILALDPDDGKLVWHYQTTPGDNWDFTATQHMILADLEIDGRVRQVLMQAPKNGFFFVVDRKTGELISAEPYVEVTWASHVDPKTGRPVEVAGQDFDDGLTFVKPTFFGGHNWHPMSFNPMTGLVYIPAQEILGAYRNDPGYKVVEGEFNVGTDFNVFAAFGPSAVSGHLLAWDPVKQREAWRVPHGLPWNGGTLTTAGNLVFQGTADGRFVAYAADTGRTLWTTHTHSGVIAAPMTYALDGVQYVTVMAGWGGAFGLVGGSAALGVKPGPGAVMTWAIPESAPTPEEFEALITKTDPMAKAERLYHVWCSRCHGAGAISRSGLPDLPESISRLSEEAFVQITTHGLSGTGMPAMGRYLAEGDAERIRSYLESRAASR
jgi:quinohemoprotein ethanol dehydrogenase